VAKPSHYFAIIKHAPLDPVLGLNHGATATSYLEELVVWDMQAELVASTRVRGL